MASCIDAIKKCWASLWTQRAYEYRQNNGFDHLAVNMAVIIQKLVKADMSGVIFTIDPLKGYESRMIIEAVPGLGDALVSGKAEPHRFFIDKKTLWIVSSTEPDGKIEPPTSDFLQNKTIIKKLTKLAKKAEKFFGCPLDIEWAIHNNKIFFLQARPITAIPPLQSWEDRQIWSSNPAKEVMPDVVTPSTFSMLLETIGVAVFDPLFRVLCCDPGDHPVYALIAGRVYFNANIWGAVF
ncbi:MAG: PEP/pyruvate-binding domain-containing protein, partial [Planctomycetota bacterium]